MDSGNGPTLSMLWGSSSIVQPARVIWALDRPDANNKGEIRLQVIKCNLGRFPEPIGMHIDGQGVVFGDAPESLKSVTAVDQAADLLLSLLSSGPMKATEIYIEVEGAGISSISAKRTKKKLGIVSKREKMLVLVIACKRSTSDV